MRRAIYNFKLVTQPFILKNEIKQNILNWDKMKLSENSFLRL